MVTMFIIFLSLHFTCGSNLSLVFRLPFWSFQNVNPKVTLHPNMFINALESCARCSFHQCQWHFPSTKNHLPRHNIKITLWLVRLRQLPRLNVSQVQTYHFVVFISEYFFSALFDDHNTPLINYAKNFKDKLFAVTRIHIQLRLCKNGWRFFFLSDGLRRMWKAVYI